METVTIGMPVYNGAKYIQSTLQSLLNQTFSDFSILICDDGSTDGTLDICQAFAARDKRIKIIKNETRLGGARNFNKTFDLSEGEFFMWASQDDIFHPDYIAKCLKKLQESPDCILALSEIDFIDEYGNSRGAVDYSNIGTAGMPIEMRIREVFRRVGWWAIYGIIRPEMLRQTKMYRSEFAGDVVLIVDMLLQGNMAKVEEPLFFYRLPLNSGTVEQNLQSIDHTKKLPDKPYTAFLQSVIRCIAESDHSVEDKLKTINVLIWTIANENGFINEKLIYENMADYVSLALGKNLCLMNSKNGGE